MTDVLKRARALKSYPNILLNTTKPSNIMRKKINITIDEVLLAELEQQAEKKNLSLSRMIENRLKGIE